MYNHENDFRRMQQALNNHSTNNFMCQIGNSDKTMSSNGEYPHEQTIEKFTNDNHDIKYLVDLYTATLHLRQRMKEEKLIHSSYSAYFNDENNNNNFYSIFHNCFHSLEILHWLIKKQLCKTLDDGKEIFQVLEKLKIIHHVCDLNQFEYPSCSSSHHNIKYLYRFRLDDGTADQNRSFQQFASIYETYTSLFTLDKNQCRGVDLQQINSSKDPYEEQRGILLKGDNLARMLALRSGESMFNIERLVDEMIVYGLVRFDECDEKNPCNCSRKFRSDEHHQYILSNSHRLISTQRLDLIPLMQNNLHVFTPLYSRNNLRISTSNSSNLINDRERSLNEFRRKKTSSLNSPLNSEYRPTADELERREFPWTWRSYTLKRNRQGYGLILQGQGPCYVERLDPYGSAFSSGIRTNEYLYAVEGINVLRRSGKEVERLLSMFDKCTVYTIYNRDDFNQISTPPNELYGKTNDLCSSRSFSSMNECQTNYHSNKINSSPNSQSSHSNIEQISQISCSSSPSSSIDGSSSCSVSPKHLQQYSNQTKKGTIIKPFQFFRFTSRSCSNTLK